MINFNNSRIMFMKRNYFTFFIISILILSNCQIYSQEFEMPGGISDLNACDFDNNGALDILVTCPYADTLVILFNNGYGGFEINYYEIIALHAICGCVDEDSIPDLIAGVGQHYYYKSNGDGTFENALSILTFSGSITVYGLVDLNYDGWNDLLYTNTSDEYWGIFKNNGDLTFTNNIIQSGSSTTDPAVGYVTEDSLPDIVMSYSAFDRSSVNVNNGNFDYTEIVLEDNFNYITPVMNLDNQGTDDFALVNYATNKVSLYTFIGNDQFELQSNFYASGTYGINSFLADDFNQDGYDDFANRRCNWYECTDSIYIYLNDHNWSFYLNQTLYTGELNWYKSRTADLNGDSYPDIYMKGYNGSNILVLLWNNGTGNFSFENPVKISEISSLYREFDIFPNPFVHNLTIELSKNLPERYSIFIRDLYGRLIKSFSVNNDKTKDKIRITWDGYDENHNFCPPGIYLVILRSNTYQISKKVIKY